MALFGAPLIPKNNIVAGDQQPQYEDLLRQIGVPQQQYQPRKRNLSDNLGLLADAFRGTNTNGQLLNQQEAADREAWQATQGALLKRAQDFADWKQQYDYEVANPKAPTDDVFTRTLVAAGIDPASAQGKQLFAQRAATLASPAPQFISDGLGGGQWGIPPAPSLPGMQQPSPGALPQGFVVRKRGGAAPSGPQTFP